MAPGPPGLRSAWWRSLGLGGIVNEASGLGSPLCAKALLRVWGVLTELADKPNTGPFAYKHILSFICSFLVCK